jgi:hypothetical protein
LADGREPFRVILIVLCLCLHLRCTEARKCHHRSSSGATGSSQWCGRPARLAITAVYLDVPSTINVRELPDI